ncbi:Transcriptional protein SWT1, partial [Candida viswanathii]
HVATLEVRTRRTQQRRPITGNLSGKSATAQTHQLYPPNHRRQDPDRVDHHHHHAIDDEDIEMVPIENDEEVDVITSYVEYLRGRTSYNTTQDHEMMVGIEEEDDTESVAVVGGNISYLVLDTNFLISHLKIVDNLKKIANEYGLKIIIPVYVIQELDGLKNSKRIHSSPYGEEDGCSGESISQLATWANRWVYSSLIDAKTIVHGQKLSQRLDKSLVKDDAILDCCLYFKETHPTRLTIVLSNDKNLCAKALMNELLTVSFRPNMSAELIAQMIHNESVQRFGKIETETPSPVASNGSNSVLAPSEEWVAKTQQIDGFSSFAEVSARVYKEIQMILLSALHHCMEEEYGDELDLVRDYDKDKVVDISDCAGLLIRFWSIVFQDYFRATPDKFVPFHESGGRRKYSKKTPIHVDIPGTPEELREFVKFWTRVLTVIYDAVMKDPEQIALGELVKRWTNMANMV